LKLRSYLLAVLCLLTAQGVVAPPPPQLDAEMEKRYKEMIAELRCLVCQNQSLADSEAELAHDLRREVLEMMQDGETDEEILKFLVARYGDFVLYRPPVKAKTLFLWAGPFLFLLLGGVLLLVLIRRRARTVTAASAELNEAEQQRLRKILEKEPQA
jgi:cytochrome c-type biogenesis protein CcmH